MADLNVTEFLRLIHDATLLDSKAKVGGMAGGASHCLLIVYQCISPSVSGYPSDPYIHSVSDSIPGVSGYPRHSDPVAWGPVPVPGLQYCEVR